MQRLHTICRKYQNLAAALLLLHCTAPHRTSFCRVRHACIECPHETCAHARALSLNRCCVFIDTVLLTRLTLFVPPKSAFTTRYIKLAKGALELLPSVEMTVYRGIRDVSLKKLLNGEDVNGILTWWAFTSTTGTSDVLRDPTFFGIGSSWRSCCFQDPNQEGSSNQAVFRVWGRRERLLDAVWRGSPCQRGRGHDSPGNAFQNHGHQHVHEQRDRNRDARTCR